MKKFIEVLSLLSSLSFPLAAQQDVQFSQNIFNKLSFNPAYAGMRQAFCVNSLYRNQWVGFPGAPKNFLVSSDVLIPSFGGLGIVLLSDQLGFDKTNIVKLSGSFHIRSLGEGTLGLGIEAGAIQKSLGNAWVYNDSGDQSIPMNGASNTIWDLGLGVYYEIERRMFFGISTSHIPQNIFKSKGNTIPFYRTVRHYFLTAGCTFFLMTQRSLCNLLYLLSPMPPQLRLILT